MRLFVSRRRMVESYKHGELSFLLSYFSLTVGTAAAPPYELHQPDTITQMHGIESQRKLRMRQRDWMNSSAMPPVRYGAIGERACGRLRYRHATPPLRTRPARAIFALCSGYPAASWLGLRG